MKRLIENIKEHKKKEEKISLSVNEIILIGNPNCGKTTIFNKLTGEKMRTGNYAGVTTGEVSGFLKKGGKKYKVTDLPGLYSLSLNKGEETVAGSVVKNKNGLYVNVVEACYLPSSLKLTRELIDSGKKVVVIINMYEELVSRGGKIDARKLSDKLGVPVVINGKNFDLADFIAFQEGKTTSTRDTKGVNLKDFFDNAGWFIPPKQIKRMGLADRLFTNAFTGVFFAFFIMTAVFYLAFGKYGLGVFLGSKASSLFYDFIEKIKLSLIETKVPAWFSDFLCEGVLKGVAGVFSFIPQLSVLYLCSYYLEESGYIARLSYLADPLLAGFGLSGRVVFPAIVGFGCTAQAVLTANSIQGKEGQRSLIMALGFIPCSARMPVVAFVASVFFPGKQFFIMFSGCLLGICFGVVVTLLYPKKNTLEEFVMELPKLRLPGFFGSVKQLSFLLKTFIIKAVAVLLCVSSLLWFLKSFSTDFVYLSGSRLSDSILAELGGALSFLFYPMGITSWQMPVVAFSGLLAKEGMIGALAVSGDNFIKTLSSESALAFIAFTFFYTPCVMALSACNKRTNLFFCAFYAFFTFIGGLLCGYVTYFFAVISNRFGIAIFIGVLLLCLTVFVITVTLKFKNNKKENRETVDDKIQRAFGREACKTYLCRGCKLRCRYETSSRKGCKSKRQKG